jgi:hypothetical protein
MDVIFIPLPAGLLFYPADKITAGGGPLLPKNRSYSREIKHAWL